MAFGRSKNDKVIKEFKSVTSCTDKIAKQYLTQNGNNLEAALNAFFSQQGSSAPTPVKKTDSSKLKKLFAGYSGEKDESNMIVDDNLEKFFNDCGIDCSGYMTMAVMFKLGCGEQGVITDKEFIEGFTKLGCDSMSAIKTALQLYQTTLATSVSEFKAFYKWLFVFTKESPDRKTLDREEALGFWTMVLPAHFTLFKDWMKFMDSGEQKNMKTISRDLWEQLLEFAVDLKAAKFKADFSDWEELGGAWPVVIDDFVEYMQAQKK